MVNRRGFARVSVARPPSQTDTMQRELRRALTLSLCVVLLSACERKDAPPPAASAPEVGSAQLVPPKKWAIPVGPRLAVLAGKGVGAIRLTAKVATVERLMEAPCEERTPKLCRYYIRGVEFHLDDQGQVERIHVHRLDRKLGEKSFGIFNGAIPPDLQFGMLPGAIQEQLGPPKEKKTGDQGAFAGTAEQHVYDGMVLEYDRMPNDQLVLGGIRIPN